MSDTKDAKDPTLGIRATLSASAECIGGEKEIEVSFEVVRGESPYSTRVLMVVDGQHVTFKQPFHLVSAVRAVIDWIHR